MNAIDHAAEARKHIDWVHEWRSYVGDTPEANLANAGIAQVHATLALVEQQRIANLIAIMSCEIAEDKSAEFSEATAALYDSGKIRPDIKKELGL